MELLFMRKPVDLKLKAGIPIFLLIVFFGSMPASVPAFSPCSVQAVAGGAKFYRTELYFGMDIPGGGSVSEQEWNRFLNEEVTPKFPDGFTVVESYGQYKDKTGKIVKEKSRMLILLYPKKLLKENDPKIEEIRTAYKKAFRQESVMRLDYSQNVIVSF